MEWAISISMVLHAEAMPRACIQSGFLACGRDIDYDISSYITVSKFKTRGRAN